MKKTLVPIVIAMCWDIANQIASRSLTRVSDEARGCCRSGVKLRSGGGLLRSMRQMEAHSMSSSRAVLKLAAVKQQSPRAIVASGPF
jgi:hypothetical protein